MLSRRQVPALALWPQKLASGRILGAALRAADTERNTAPNAEFLTCGILKVAA
jgi:hypothetical protein